MSDIKEVISSGEKGLGLPMSVLGIFFFVQSYGYSLGAGLEPPASIAEAVVHGMSHLSHLVTPWAPVAWPLTPSLCAVMLLYCAVLPEQMALGVRELRVARQNRRFLAMMSLLLAATAFSGVMLRTGQTAVWARFRQDHMFLPPTIYASAMVIGFLAFDRLLRWKRLKYETWKSPPAPWPLLLSVLAIGLLYMIAFIGSQVDGQIDCMTG